MKCWTCQKEMTYLRQTAPNGEDVSKWVCLNPKCKTNKETTAW